MTAEVSGIDGHRPAPVSCAPARSRWCYREHRSSRADDAVCLCHRASARRWGWRCATSPSTSRRRSSPAGASERFAHSGIVSETLRSLYTDSVHISTHTLSCLFCLWRSGLQLCWSLGALLRRQPRHGHQRPKLQGSRRPSHLPIVLSLSRHRHPTSYSIFSFLTPFLLLLSPNSQDDQTVLLQPAREFLPVIDKVRVKSC
jgi:hypothetical protein